MVVTIILLLIVLLYFAVWYFENFKDKGRAPGPYRFPPFGSLIQVGRISKVTHVALGKLAKDYGDVMSIKMGFLETVILSSPEAIRSILSRDETAARECTGMLWDRNLKQNIGLNFCNGPEQAEIRKFCKDTLRNYGFGNRESMQLLVLDELIEFATFIDTTAKSNSNRVVHFNPDFFTPSFLNLTCKLLMGRRFDYNDSEFQKILEGLHMLTKNGALGSGIMLAYPFLRYIFPETLGYTTQMNGIRTTMGVALKHLSERRNLPYKDQPECLTDHFLQKMDEDKYRTHSLFTEDCYSVLFGDIVTAGADTTSNVVNFAILLLATYPTIQEKVYEEILEVIGPYCQPHLKNKPAMLYTQAVLLEVLRWHRVVVFGAPRMALEDITYRDIKIKKGTSLMFNLHAVFFNEEIWGDPQIFRPERFLDNGKLNEQKSNIMQIVFGAGSKRNCFGEVLARDSLFLYTTTLIQKFKFALPPGSQPDLEPGVGIVLFANPYDAIVTLRNESGYE